MKRFSQFVDKTKAKLNDQQQPLLPVHPSHKPVQMAPPSYEDVRRYRYHHGTNCGTIFILERWMCGSMFPEGGQGSSELAAVQAWISREGIDATKSRFEKHWSDYVSDSNLDWLRDNGKITTIRLPIGYFTLGPDFCKGTPFEGVSKVYEQAWSAVKQMVQRCEQRGIGVLVDLHGLPGGANDQDHSGTNSGKCELWGNRYNLDLGKKCLSFIATQTKSMAGVIGIQLDNEAKWDAPGMYEWYNQVIDEQTNINVDMPIYVSDGWNLDKCLQWQQERNTINALRNPIVIDTHLYWAFSQDDKNKSPQQIISEVGSKLSTLDSKAGNVFDRGAAQVFVGEYSCVLTEDSWAKCGGQSKDELVRQFGNTQSQSWQQKAGGSTFWTYRVDWMPGGEWGVKAMIDAHAIQAPQWLQVSKNDVDGRVNKAKNQRQGCKDRACSAHANYWDSKHPGTYEHWRYDQGWETGFDDAVEFFKARKDHGLDGADKIGMLDLWCLKRIRESKSTGKFGWEYEQGLRQGINDAYQALGM